MNPEGGDALGWYNIEWKHRDVTDVDFLYATPGTIPYNYTIMNLIPGTTYEVRIQANNNFGRGNYTDYLSVTTGKN